MRTQPCHFYFSKKFDILIWCWSIGQAFILTHFTTQKTQHLNRVTSSRPYIIFSSTQLNTIQRVFLNLTISSQNIENHDFFFCQENTCPSLCPLMSPYLLSILKFYSNHVCPAVNTRLGELHILGQIFASCFANYIFFFHYHSVTLMGYLHPRPLLGLLQSIMH